MKERWRAASEKLIPKITSRHVVLVAAICLVAVLCAYAATGNLESFAVLGTRQCAVVSEVDAQCTPDQGLHLSIRDKKEQCPKKQKDGGFWDASTLSGR